MKYRSKIGLLIMLGIIIILSACGGNKKEEEVEVDTEEEVGVHQEKTFSGFECFAETLDKECIEYEIVENEKVEKFFTLIHEDKDDLVVKKKSQGGGGFAGVPTYTIYWEEETGEIMYEVSYDAEIHNSKGKMEKIIFNIDMVDYKEGKKYYTENKG